MRYHDEHLKRIAVDAIIARNVSDQRYMQGIHMLAARLRMSPQDVDAKIEKMAGWDAAECKFDL